VARRLQQSLCGEDVVVQVEVEFGSPARAHPRLRGEMEHDLDAVQGPIEGDLAEVSLDEVESIPAREAVGIGALSRRLVEIGEAINAAHGVALVEQPLGEARADEARRSGYQSAHRQIVDASPQPTRRAGALP
jgi:hypothetical protein